MIVERRQLVAGVLVAVALVTGFFLVPSPFDRAAERQATQLQVRVEALEAELSKTQSALAEESSTRAALDAETETLLADLAASYEAQYESIVTSFADAADIACAGDATPAAEEVSDVARAAECNARDLAGMAQDLADQPVVCGVMPVGAVESRDLDRCVMLYAHSSDVVVDSLAVTSKAGEGFEVILSTAASVDAGDTLDVSAYFRVTNELLATVGVAGHLWAYDLDGDTTKQWRIGPANGDNVDRQRHHMPVAVSTIYSVPPDWPDGHRMAVVLKADAHSTATNGDLEVDRNGNLIVRITKA